MDPSSFFVKMKRGPESLQVQLVQTWADRCDDVQQLNETAQRCLKRARLLQKREKERCETLVKQHMAQEKMPDYLRLYEANKVYFEFTLSNFPKSDNGWGDHGTILFGQETLKILWAVDNEYGKPGKITFYPKPPQDYFDALIEPNQAPSRIIARSRPELIDWEDALPVLKETQWFHHFWPIEKCQAILKLLV